MKFIPYNIGTFLVRSRSRHAIEHHIDLIECNCSCEAYQISKMCGHLKEAYTRRKNGRLPIIVAMKGRDDTCRNQTMEETGTTAG